MDRFEFDFDNMRRIGDVETARRVFTVWVGLTMAQLFILCVCALIVLFWANKFTFFLLSLMTLLFITMLIAVYTTKMRYKSKLKAMEDEA
nr:hypothetical protein [uncultured Trichococcus sp.]